MFWNKKQYNPPVVNTALQNLKEQMNVIDSIYKHPENAGNKVSIDMYQDSESIGIISNYHNKMKQLSQLTKDAKEMRAVIEGNGGYWGQYQDNYKECQDRLELVTLKLKIEQELYLKIYQKNRELESEVYLLQRELEILKGVVE